LQADIAAEAARLDLGPSGAGDALAHLNVTRAAVQEALRLYPPAFSIVRQALTADDAAGVPIPAGAIVQTAPWVLHRHRQFWDGPDVFDHTRFMPGATPPQRFTFLPFGIGQRACIAAQFAQVEAVLAVAILIRAFHVSPVTDRPVTPIAQITLQPYNPSPFRLTGR
jgi:cytochrome P450